MIEKKKIDIYSLYKQEKTIRIEDDAGNYTDVLMVKMTQGQRAKVLESYNEYLEAERARLRERETKFKTLALAIERYTVDDIITGIVAFESAQRGEIADLLPSLDNKTQEERDKLIIEEIEKFKKTRKETLEKQTKEDLKQQFISMTIESQALLNSVYILNYSSLVAMCLDSETRQPLFNSIDDIQKIADRRIIDKLTNELTTFRELENQKVVREITTNDSNFLPTGVSPESSTDSPVTTS